MASDSRHDKKNRWLKILVVTLIYFGFCSLSYPQSTKSGTLKVGVYNNPPKVYINDQGKADGLFINILREICSEEVELEFVQGNWADLRKKLETDEIQVLPDVAFSEDRDSLYLINSVPVISSWLEAFVTQNSNVSEIEDFEGLKVGVLKGSVQEIFFSDFPKRQNNMNFQVVPFPSYSQSVKALHENDIDILVASRFFSYSDYMNHEIKTSGLIFRPSSLHFAFSKSVDPSFVTYIDSELSRQKNDPNSYYYKTLNASLNSVSNPIPPYIWWIVGITLLLLLLTLGFLILLRYQVKIKTRALWKRNRQLTRAKEKAEENERLKTIFLQNMSHEIRTPMNGIIGFLELLKKPDLNPEDRDKYIDVVIKSGKRLLTTINNIIEISKINSDQITVHPTPVHIPEIMDFFHSFFEPQAREKGIDLRKKTDAELQHVRVLTDKFILDNILTNLINNAIKFTDKGSVEFGNYRKGDNLVFYVNDTGVGIPKERQKAVFERFVQADLNHTRAHEGSGLGLAIVSAYVKSLEGKFWMRSEVNQGSSFYFSIPFVPVEEKETPPNNENQLTSLSGKKLDILVAEDDSISFLFLSKILDFPEVNLIRAATGQECVDYLRAHPNVNLVLMDVKMPVLDGMEATREIRTFNTEVPILIQTAYSSSEDQEKALESGANDYITKPIEPSRLLELIHKYT